MLDLQVQIRRLPKPVIAMVAGYAIGGGHVLHVVCDLTIAADNARFGQTGPKVGSFDGGYGAGYLARIVGHKKAREIWYLCRQYDAQQALDMGLVNTVVPLERLEEETVQWCREMLAHSPHRAAHAEGRLQRRHRRARRAPAVRRRRDDALLHDRRGAGRAQRLRGEAPARLLPLSAAAVTEAAIRLAGAGRVPLRIWLVAARPRTLPAAIAPVLVGTALAGSEDVFRPLAFVAALFGSIFIQIGTNLSNDYSDARRGADTEDRLGPVRVTAAGLVAPRQVLVATWLAFAVAVAFGVYLIALVGWELLAIGAVSIIAGVLYTGGPRPYGYEGLGELFVFLFFGIVAVVGSYYVQTEELRALAFALAVPVGLLAAGDPDDQQHPRPRDRPPRRKANARGAARPDARPSPLRGDHLAAFVWTAIVSIVERQAGATAHVAVGRTCAEPRPRRWRPAPTVPR